MSEENKSNHPAFPNTNIYPENIGLTKLEWMVGQVLPMTAKIFTGYDSAVEAAIEIATRALDEIEKRQS